MKITRILMFIIMTGLIIFTSNNTSEIVHAIESQKISSLNNSDSNIPSLEIYQSGNEVKAEWAVEILPQDVLYETGFEVGDELPNLIYGSIDKGGGKTGGQSFSTERPYSGLRSLRVEDTYSNGQQSGNPINGVVPFSNMSRTRFLEQKYVDNGIDLSLSLKVKTTANANIRAEAQGVKADYGINMKETFAEDVKVGDYTTKVSDITIFKNTIDSGRLYYLADSKGQYNTIHAHSYDEANSTITVNRPFRYNFKKGDNVIQHRAVVPLSFPRRDVNSKEWTTINMNTKVPSYPYYDIKKRGFSFVLYNATRGIMYIDDLKLGYATQTELYRDGQRIYQGKLSDFEDKQANDKEKPNKVVDYNVSLKSGKQYINVIEPKDNGTQYSYQVKAISNDGSGEYWSETKDINVATGIQGYSYVIDKNKSTNPSGNVNSNNGEIEVDKNVYKDHYLHIQAVDGAGNKSEVSHIKLDKIQDIYPPELNVTPSTTDWTNDSVTIYVDATDEHSGIKEVFVVGKNTIRNGNFAEGEDEWEFVAPKDSLKIEDGEAKFNTSGVSELRNTSLVQNEVLRDGLRNDFRINVSVKGNGALNTRFRVINTELAPKNEPVQINSDEYEEHVFYVPYDKEWADGIVIELLGNGYLYVNNVEMYETSEVKDGKIDVHENGVYEFSVADNAGNITTKSIEITNIDKTAPEVNITPNITKDTHENVILNVDASDSLSGIQSITYLGENMIKDGTFENGYEHWDAGGSGGEIRVENGMAILDDNNVSGNKLRQTHAFKDSEMGAQYYAEVEARGEGVINARYAFSQTPPTKGNPNPERCSPDQRFAETLSSSEEFKVYTFPIERRNCDNDSFHIERIGKDGWIEISSVKVYARKDITDSKELEVTQNGTYTFVVVDNANNTTTKSITVDNIDKYTKLHKPIINDFDTKEIQDKNVTVNTPISKLIVEDWRNNPEWSLQVHSTGLMNDDYEIPLLLREVSTIEKTEGTGKPPNISYINKRLLSEDRISIISKNNSRGKHVIDFENGLETSISSDVRVGKYNAKVTWELVTAP